MTDNHAEDSEVLFCDKRFSVVRRTIELADGRVIHRPVIEHGGSVAVLPVLDDGRIVLIENRRHVVRQTLLELPAGMLDPGEEPRQAAWRELAEETGYRAGRIEHLASFYTSPGILSERMHLFLATQLQAGPASPEPSEQILSRPVAADEAIEMVRSGCICDGKTILGLLFWQRFAAPSQRLS